MKPAFSYYGGKQRMAPKIVPLIPRHTVYVEPFAGGAAVFFAKPWPRVGNSDHYREVLNDTNGHIVNFYKQLRDNGEELARLCELTPYSREDHKIAKDLDNGDDLERARKWFINIQQSFANGVGGGWVTSNRGRNQAATWANQTRRLHEAATRLHSVYIEHLDALNVIKKWDSPHTLFYCDPPYVDTCQGHYEGYSRDDFNNLIETLDSIEGSFLLSHYAGDHNTPEDWERFDFNTRMSVRSNTSGTDDTKIEHSRVEVVYRGISKKPVRKEIQELYDSGKFDCFASGEQRELF